MSRRSDLLNQGRFSYPQDTREVHFLPNPSLSSNQRLLTPSVASSLYENEPPSMDDHNYEDPSRLAQQSQTNGHRGPRKKHNNLYEPTALPLRPIKNTSKCVQGLSASDESLTTGFTYPSREPCYHRYILYLVLLLSLTATVLVILMIVGVVGPSCHCQQSNPTTGQAQASYSLAAEPLQLKLESLQHNLTRLENALKKNQSRETLQVVGVNGSVSLDAIQQFVDTKINMASNKLLASDNELGTRLLTINNTLISQIRELSKLEGPQGHPGVNGSEGPQGVKGPPGADGAQGPPGPGNFSACTYHKEFRTQHAQGISSDIVVEKQEPEGFVLIGPACSTVGAKEYNLKVAVPPLGGHPNFICTCKGQSNLFPPILENPGDSNKKIFCYLHYWLCPRTT